MCVCVRYFAGLEMELVPCGPVAAEGRVTGVLLLCGHYPAWVRQRTAASQFSKELQRCWMDALRSDDPRKPKHSVVFAAQAGDDERIFGGYASSGGGKAAMVLDMVDVGTMAQWPKGGDGDDLQPHRLSRMGMSFNLFWVFTHELVCERISVTHLSSSSVSHPLLTLSSSDPLLRPCSLLTFT